MQRSKLYNRKRILNLLRQMETYPVTVVVASTGYGKTTAVCQYLAQSETPYLYLDITSHSENLFWLKLCESLNDSAPAAAQALRLNGLPVDDVKLASAVEIVRKLVPVPLLLVLDDCQLLAPGSRIFKLLAVLAREEVPGLHLVLLSQKMPPIRVGSLVFKDRCLLVERETLAFTPEETKGYLDRRGMHLAPEAVANIHRQSGGWISILFLICEAFLHGRLDYRISSLNQMFEENFLLDFTPGERETLTRLSVLDEFTAELAIAATGNRQSSKILSLLEKNNAFITCDEQGWYHFHTLLQNYLRSQCPQDKRQKEFYLRAGRWYRTQQQYPLALRLYGQGGALEQFLRDMEPISHWSRNCRTILQGMAPELAKLDWTKYPGSFLEVAFALLRTGRDSSSRLGYQILKAVEAWAQKDLSAAAHKIWGDCILIQTFLGLYDDDDWNKHFERAQGIMQGEQSRVLQPADSITFGMPMFLYLEYRKPGVLDQVVDQDSRCPLEKLVTDFGHGMDKVVRAEAALVRCRMDETENYARQALVATRSAHQYFLEMCALFTLLRKNLFTGDYIAALEQLENMREAASQALDYWQHYAEELYRQVLEYSEVFLYTALGQTEKLPGMYLGLSAMPDHMMGGMGLFNLLRARAAYLLGDISIAAGACDLVLDLKEQQVQHSQLIRLGALILKSRAETKLGNEKQALQLLSTALQEAAPDGIYLLFAESADELLPLLLKLKGTDRVPREYLQQLEIICRQQKDKAVNWRQPTLTKTLSERELEALRLAARGLNQNQIAAEMQVKTVTAKKHLIKAYAKLGAPNKVAAIQIAKTQKLL